MTLHVYIILGSSNSGKSTLARKLTRKTKRKTYVLNDRTGNERIFEKMEIADFEKMRNCAAIVEDVICLPDRERHMLQTLLNFNSNHFNVQPIFILTHSIKNNNIFSLLSFVRGIIFMTQSASSIGSLKTIFNFYNVEKSESKNFLQKWSEHKKQFEFFYFDIEKGSFTLNAFDAILKQNYEANFKNDEPTLKKYIAKEGERIFNLLGYKKKLAVEILQFIINSFKLTSFDRAEFTLTFNRKSKNDKNTLKINLIQFVQNMISKKKCEKNHIIFFKILLSKNDLIPPYFVYNPSFERILKKTIRRKIKP